MQPKHADDHTGKDQLQAVWFAAGMAVVIACLERAAVLSIFRQWHMWVFLALNLLLIAILFTSTHPRSNPPRKSPETDGESQTPGPATDNHREDAFDEVAKLSDEVRENDVVEDEGVDEDEGDDEELNERVEAFISKFRQQYLVSDVKFSRSITV